MFHSMQLYITLTSSLKLLIHNQFKENALTCQKSEGNDHSQIQKLTYM